MDATLLKKIDTSINMHRHNKDTLRTRSIVLLR